MTKITEFDKRKTYEEKVEPLMKEVSKICTAYGIPFFFTACTKNDSSGSVYQNDAYPCGSSGIVLQDDKITPHLKVVLGFRTVAKDESLEIIYDDDSVL